MGREMRDWRVEYRQLKQEFEALKEDRDEWWALAIIREHDYELCAEMVRQLTFHAEFDCAGRA